MNDPVDTVVAPGIVTNPARMGGRPTIDGTRITVERILGMLAANYTFDDILRAYPHLNYERIRDAINYAEQLVHDQTPAAAGSAEVDW